VKQSIDAGVAAGDFRDYLYVPRERPRHPAD